MPTAIMMIRQLKFSAMQVLYMQEQQNPPADFLFPMNFLHGIPLVTTQMQDLWISLTDL